MTILVLALKYLNIFQESNGLSKPIALVFIIVLSSFFTIKIQRKIDTNYANGEYYYNNIDLIKYIFSILIIILHFRPFFNSSD